MAADGKMSCILSEGVTLPSSLVRAHAPVPFPLPYFGFLIRVVFAGCCQPLLRTGPSRHYLCNPCEGDWTHTPPCSSGAYTHFFPKDFGLTPWQTRSAHRTTAAMRLQQRAVFRGCSHLFTFSLPHLLGPQVAPTVTGFRRPGSQAVYTAHSPDGYPFWDAVSLHDRHG